MHVVMQEVCMLIVQYQHLFGREGNLGYQILMGGEFKYCIVCKSTFTRIFFNKSAVKNCKQHTFEKIIISVLYMCKINTP